MAEQDPKNSETERNEAQQPQQGDAQLETAAEVAEAAEAQPQALSAEEEIAGLHEQLAGAKDAVLRAQAEAQNSQRRAEQDVEKARKFALERFAGDLLPVVDNLERALESAAGDDELVKPIAEGVQLTLNSLVDVLGKFNVVTIDPQGQPFDPNLHQAMSMVENKDVEPNTVIGVMQKGYSLNGRLVRPAMVMVSKAAS